MTRQRRHLVRMNVAQWLMPAQLQIGFLAGLHGARIAATDRGADYRRIRVTAATALLPHDRIRDGEVRQGPTWQSLFRCPVGLGLQHVGKANGDSIFICSLSELCSLRALRSADSSPSPAWLHRKTKSGGETRHASCALTNGLLESRPQCCESTDKSSSFCEPCLGVMLRIASED